MDTPQARLHTAEASIHVCQEELHIVISGGASFHQLVGHLLLFRFWEGIKDAVAYALWSAHIFFLAICDGWRAC